MFVPYKGVPDDAAEFEVAVIANSQTLTVGDAIVPGATTHTKAVTGAASSSTTILGVVTAILNAQGGYTGLQSVTAGAANETAATTLYQVQYLPTAVPGVKYLATLSAAAGTTTNSDGIGSFNMYSTNDKLDETSIALFSATEKQFVSLGLDMRDTTKKTIIGYWGKTLSA